jgi:hypothetical protein
MAKQQPRKANQGVPRTVLRLPDLDQAKSAVLNSFSSIDAQRRYMSAKVGTAPSHGLNKSERYVLKILAEK